MDFHGKSDLLGRVLVAHGMITEAQLESALAQQKVSGERLGDILINNGWISEQNLMKGISRQLIIPFVDLACVSPSQKILDMVPLNIVERLHIFPLGIENGKLRVAISEPLNLLAIDELRLITGFDITLAVATLSDIFCSIDRHYKRRESIDPSFERDKSFRLGELLFASGVITEKQLNIALEEQKTSGEKVGEIILAHGWINELQLTDALSKQLHIPMVLLASYEPSTLALKKVPRAFAEHNLLLPLAIMPGNVLRIAVSYPLNRNVVEELRDMTGCDIEYALALPSAFKRELPRYYRMLDSEGIAHERMAQKGALLGELLMNDGVITKKQLEEGLDEQRVNSMRLGDILIKNGVISEKQLAKAISSQLGLPVISLDDRSPDPEALGIVPRMVAERLQVIPISVEGVNTLRIAIAEPLNLLAIDELRTFTGMNIDLSVTTPTEIRSRIAVFYKGVDSKNDLMV